MHLPIIQGLDYSAKLKAQALINKGISYDALYFWFNLLQGHYKQLPHAILENDLQRMIKKYPQFKTEFEKLTIQK